MSEVLRASLVEYREGKRPCFTTSYRDEFGETVNVQNIVTMDEIREIRNSCDKILPKRNPLPDGTLELTEEERDEFKQFFDGLPFHRVKIIKYLQEVHFMYEALLGEYYITNIKAILWLADRFNLEGQDATNI